MGSVISWLLIIVVLVVGVTQFIIPLVNGTPILPFFLRPEDDGEEEGGDDAV